MQKDSVAGPQNSITEMLCKLVKEQSAQQVDLEPFDGNPLEYTYFMSKFRESVEKKIEDPKGRLTRLMTDQNMGTIMLWKFSIGSMETHTL